MTLRRRAAAQAVVCAVLLSLAPSGVRAQLPHLDAMPWIAPADSSSRLALLAGVDRFVDDSTNWTANRVMLTALMPAGQNGVFFLRLPYLSFDTDGYSVAERWPETVGDEQPADWPGGERLVGFGQIEVGATGPTGLAGLGAWQYAVALGLPTGQNTLYPWSSTSLPLRLQARRDMRSGGPWHLWLGGGYLLHMDASGDNLSSAAFPNGWLFTAEWALLRGRGSSWHLNLDWEDRNTRRSLQVGAQVWLPWTADGSCGLRLVRELENTDNRPAQWRLTLAWRFDSPAHRPEAEPAAE